MHKYVVRAIKNKCRSFWSSYLTTYLSCKRNFFLAHSSRSLSLSFHPATPPHIRRPSGPEVLECSLGGAAVRAEQPG